MCLRKFCSRTKNLLQKLTIYCANNIFIAVCGWRMHYYNCIMLRIIGIKCNENHLLIDDFLTKLGRNDFRVCLFNLNCRMRLWNIIDHPI